MFGARRQSFYPNIEGGSRFGGGFLFPFALGALTGAVLTPPRRPYPYRYYPYPYRYPHSYPYQPFPYY